MTKVMLANSFKIGRLNQVQMSCNRQMGAIAQNANERVLHKSGNQNHALTDLSSGFSAWRAIAAEGLAIFSDAQHRKKGLLRDFDAPNLFHALLAFLLLL